VPVRAGLRSAGRMPSAKRDADGPSDEPGSKRVAGGGAAKLLSPLIDSIFHPEQRKKTVPRFFPFHAFKTGRIRLHFAVMRHLLGAPNAPRNQTLTMHK